MDVSMLQDNTQNSSAWVRERRTAAAADRAERAASAAERAAVAAESAAERARASTVTEPRPYYRRVQQHLQSGCDTIIETHSTICLYVKWWGKRTRSWLHHSDPVCLHNLGDILVRPRSSHVAKNVSDRCWLCFDI